MQKRYSTNEPAQFSHIVDSAIMSKNSIINNMDIVQFSDNKNNYEPRRGDSLKADETGTALYDLVN